MGLQFAQFVRETTAHKALAHSYTHAFNIRKKERESERERLERQHHVCKWAKERKKEIKKDEFN